MTVNASGPGARGAADQMRIVTTPVTGDFQVKMDLLSATGGAINGYQAPQVGIMIRETNDPGSPYYTALSDPTYPAENQTQPNLIMFFRDRFNVQTTELTQAYPLPYPRWMMIQRKGDTFQTLQSPDGVNWTLLSGTVHKVVMRSTLMVGMGVSAGVNNAVETATFNGFQVGPITQTTYNRQASAHPCPNTWSCIDVGAGSPIGDQTLTNGTWTIQGSAAGIGQSQDVFHYVYQKLNGDGTISGRLTSLGNSNAAAQAAMVMRADTSMGSAFYGIVNTAGKGATVTWRLNNNLGTTRLPIPITVTMPEYFQIARFTDTTHHPVVTYYSALTSTDGANWTQVPGSTVAVNLGNTPVAGIGGSSNANRTLNPSTWTNVATSNTVVKPPGICPDTFTCEDIGTGYAPGSQQYNTGTWTFNAGGSDIWNVYDQFHYAYQAMPADGSISARVVSIANNAAQWAKTGVMIRATNDPQAPYYGVFVTAQHGVQVQWRTTPGAITNSVTGPANKAPSYVLASRWTDTRPGGLTYYTAYTSTDGKTWTVVPGSTVPLTMPGQVLSGIAADSNVQAHTAQVVFDSVNQLPSAPRPPGICPSTWTCDDIGGAAPPASQDVDANGVWTVKAGGGDIWGASDQFHLIWQALNGDGSVSARLASATTAGPWAKDGVMLRASSDPAAPYYGVFVTPQHGTVVQYRSVQGGGSSQVATTGVAPLYLKVQRFTDGSGNQLFSAYTSPDGVTWTLVPNSTVILTLPAQLEAGLAGDSHTQGTASTITFDNVVLGAATAPPGACPALYTCTDIGGPTPAGTQNLSSGTWTVGGGGGDISGIADQFHLVSQTRATDGSVTVQLTSQTNTNPWAKAGAVARDSSAAGAAYYGVFVTPGNGIALQWRPTDGAQTRSLAFAGTIPTWLRITRTGTSFTAFTSADGATWTPLANSTMTIAALTGTLVEGLAVTSHDTGQLCTVTAPTFTIS